MKRDTDREVRNLLHASMESCGLKREEIAQRMSAVLGSRVTKTALDQFTRTPSGERPARFPAAWIRAFCEVTKSLDVAIVSNPDELQKLIEIGKHQVRSLDESENARKKSRAFKASYKRSSL